MATGNYFGEQALIDGGGADSKKRSATIRCTDHCFFGLLSKTEYNNVLKKEHSAALKPVIDFYSSTMYCKLLQPDLNLKLAHVTQLRKWKKGDLVFQAGDVVDSMIFLLSGECLITKDVYLGAESALRGSAPASLTGSCHPGLRQDTKKITIDIATVCGHGDIVGETELLAEVIAEMKAASKEKREKEKQKVREKRQKAAQKADTADKLSSPKNSKAKARNKGPAEPEFERRRPLPVCGESLLLAALELPLSRRSRPRPCCPPSPPLVCRCPPAPLVPPPCDCSPLIETDRRIGGAGAV